MRAIAQSVLDAGPDVLSEPSLKVDTDLPDPMMAHFLDQRIRRFGFQ
jgi:hypothetical protein